jgi:hypothetical protein
MGAKFDATDTGYVRRVLQKIKNSDPTNLDAALHDAAAKLHRFIDKVCEEQSECHAILLNFILAVANRGETKERAIAIWLKHAVQIFESDIARYRRFDVEPDMRTLEAYRTLKREFILASS